ncbi:MAG: ribonuclease J [Candidatus Epulonipiscioides saccharophilum]|nr:MAG: ribonuclease J [Epulopiscium sp. AS2M-Bin001]
MRPKQPKPKLKIISLGGLGEVGKNMTVLEYENDIIVVDCGLAFPGDEMLGIDLVIPDVTYLVKNIEKIRAFVITHGHEDHIGGLPYILKEVNIPIYGTSLTNALIENKLIEHGLMDTTTRIVIQDGETIKFGNSFKVEFISSNHSITDSVMLSIWTPVGTIIHTGDFKIDYTPIRGKVLNLHRLAELGQKGVLALLSDSTNSERQGYTQSERVVGETFTDVFSKYKDRRIMVATFASNVDRVQQIINAASQTNRKVTVMGRSMVNVVKIASELGYLDIPKNILIEVNDLKRYPDDKVVIIMTGSQGEPMAALSRMSKSEHRQVEIKPGDIVILSATPIPGNEKTVSNVINDLTKKGAIVIKDDTHVSGHAAQEEQKLLIALIKPKYFVPVHGEYRHLQAHANTAINMGIAKENIPILAIGDVLSLDKTSMKVTGTVPSGQVLVDGLGVGDVGNIVLRDRKHLSEDGLLIAVMTLNSDGFVVAGPDIISRGFVYVREAENLMDQARNVVRKTLDKCEKNQIMDWMLIKTHVRDDLRDFVWQKTKRSPMVLPIIMEI